MKKKYCYAILYIIWMLVTFWFSAQVADDSQRMSDSFMHLLNAVLSLDIMRNEIIRNTIGFLVRKATHMSEYTVLVTSFGLTIRECRKESWLLLVLAATATYTATGELHQLLVPGRDGQFKDALINTADDVLGLGLLALILYLKCIRKMKETGEPLQNIQGPLTNVGI